MVSLHIGEAFKIVYIIENKVRYMFKANIVGKSCEGIYALSVEKVGKPEEYNKEIFIDLI